MTLRRNSLLVAFGIALFLLLGSSTVRPFPETASLQAAPLLQSEPTPEPLPTPEVVEEVAVDLLPNNTQIEAGETVTYTVMLTNTTADALSSLVISGTIPPSTTFLTSPNSPVTYDEITETLTWDVGTVSTQTVLTATYQLQAQTALTNTQMVAGVHATSPDLTGTVAGWDVIDVGTPPTDTKWITPEGGFLQAGDTPVTLLVPTDVITEPLAFTVVPLLTTLDATMWNAFDFTASTTTKEVVSTFPSSVTVAINLADQWDSVLAMEGTPSIYWLNESTDTWEEVPSEMNWATGVVSAQVTHFSGYGSGGSDNGSYGVEHLPTLGRFSSDEWSGNSTVNYGFALPPAPGNMPFGLNLGYSSEGVNSLFGMHYPDVSTSVNRYARQAGAAGWGWSIGGLGSINPHGSNYASIRAGSVSGTVVLHGPGAWDWQTDPQQFVKIHSMNGWSDQTDAKRTTRWELFTQDGTRYTFGGDSYASSAVAYNRNVTPNCSGSNYEITRELHLSEIRDRHGNRIVIDYEREMRDWSPGASCGSTKYPYVRAIRPRYITYYAAGVTDGTAQIEFDYGSGTREDYAIENWNNQYVQSLYDLKRLESIKIRIRGSGGTYDPAQQYSFVYDYVSFGTTSSGVDQKLMRLLEIKEMGQDWYNGVSLPAYKFEYTKLNSSWLNTTTLSKAHNGQGGRVEYLYGFTSGIPIGGCYTESPQEYAARYFLQQTKTFDGLSSTPVQQLNYTYSYPYAHADASPSCTQDFEFGGYGEVRKEIRDGAGTLLQWGVNQYHTGTGTSGVAPQAGKLSNAYVYEPSNKLVTHTASTWVVDYVQNTPWVHLQASTTITKGEGTGSTATPDVSRKTEYFYNEANQPSGIQKGLQTNIVEWANGTKVRSSETWYLRHANPAIYQFLPRATRTYAYSGPNSEYRSCTGTTRYAYDWLAYNTAPSALNQRGNLTDVWTATDDCENSHTTVGNSWIQTRTNYDEWGNPTISTDPRGNATYITYDTTGAWPKLYAYPIHTQAALSMNTSYTWNKFLGQVEVVTAPNGAQTNYRYDEWGRLLKMWKPGDSATYPTQSTSYYHYDALSSRPYMVNVAQRTNLSSDSFNYVTQSATFYDGLGRALQSRSAHFATSGSAEQWVITLNRYHPLGGVAEQYAPITVTPDTTNTLRFYHYGDTTANWASKPKTTNTYDAMGRVLSVTDPSGAVSRQSYGTESVGGIPMLKNAVVDANRHRTRYRTDALGRMHSIVEQMGNCSNGYEPIYACDLTYYTTQWYDYATTTYSYDTEDQLLQVDRWPNTTGAAALTMTYDLAGRKITMNDPDMGTWGYVYDKAGNLVAQRDANNAALCFEYDALNRVTKKHAYVNITNPWNVVGSGYSCTGFLSRRYEVQTTYGTSGYDKGMRTSVDVISHESGFNNSTGGQSWSYDARGRVLDETTRIVYNSATYRFQFGYTYDAADRVRTVQYPDDTPLDAVPSYGETVTYQYTDPQQLLLRGAQGTATYLTDRQYNHFGQLAQQTYGTVPNTLQTYSYYPLTTANGQGRVQSVVAGIRQNLSYTYDATGNILSINDAVNGNQLQTFQYDNRDRLFRYEVSGGSSGTIAPQWFFYDTVGNLTEVTGSVERDYNYGAQRSVADGCTNGALNPAHAPTKISDSSITIDYCYNAVGNMVERDNGTVEEWLVYDMENRLTHHWNTTNSINATFAYNGDGARVRATINGVTTLYAGLIEYEIDGSSTTLTKYYDVGGQRVAVRNGASLNFLLNDHLGSTSVMLKTNGTLWGELRYSAWGETRHASGNIVTDRQYTGQINDGDTGLYYYNARYYDPLLHKFIQADTIVPDPSNPQTLNRYAYVNNNPLKYIDPTGHETEQVQNSSSCTTGDDWCWQNRWYNAHGLYWNGINWNMRGVAKFQDMGILQDVLEEMGIRSSGAWKLNELSYIGQALIDFAEKIGGSERVKYWVGGTNFSRQSVSTWKECTGQIAACTKNKDIEVYDLMFTCPTCTPNYIRGSTIHELGHVIDGITGWFASTTGGARVYITPSTGLYGYDPNNSHTITDYSNTNAEEYWAEAMALWVYPNYQRNHGHRALLPRQSAFIDKLLRE